MAIELNMVGISRDAYKSIGIPVISIHIKSPLQQQIRVDLIGVFFNSLEFGSTCRYRHYPDSTSFSLCPSYQCILDTPSDDEGFGSPTRVTNSQKILQIPVHSMRKYPKSRDSLLLDGIEYLVKDCFDDGVGVVTLNLQRRGGAFQ